MIQWQFFSSFSSLWFLDSFESCFVSIYRTVWGFCDVTSRVSGVTLSAMSSLPPGRAEGSGLVYVGSHCSLSAKPCKFEHLVIMNPAQWATRHKGKLPTKNSDKWCHVFFFCWYWAYLSWELLFQAQTYFCKPVC